MPTEQKLVLLRIARNEILKALQVSVSSSEQKLYDDALATAAITSALHIQNGVFVTLTIKEENSKYLRGCIGCLSSTNSLYLSVKEYALNAAFHDPRFPPLEKDELERLEIEITVLSEPKAIPSYKDIKLGEHGIILQHEGRSAVFLPHVAIEQKWTLDQTLSHLSTKAALSPLAYKEEGTEFLVFSGLHFSESELSPRLG